MSQTCCQYRNSWTNAAGDRAFITPFRPRVDLLTKQGVVDRFSQQTLRVAFDALPLDLGVAVGRNYDEELRLHRCGTWRS